MHGEGGFRMFTGLWMYQIITIKGISSQFEQLAAEEYRFAREHHPLDFFRTFALHHLGTPFSTWPAQHTVVQVCCSQHSYSTAHHVQCSDGMRHYRHYTSSS